MANDPSDLLMIDVRCDEAAPSTVRQSMTRLDDLGWMLGDAMLIASELVTNAVRHSGCCGDDQLQVKMTQRKNRILISVEDLGLSGERAVTPATDLQASDGLSLLIVSSVAAKWGTEREPGYRVWAELQTTGAAGWG